ncbi:MAG TPA: ABC transporter permease [Polyangia bacterium]|nr:ABC transporter permease [Polyangia bacterium]
MKLDEMIRAALRALLRNKMRTFLTSLGMTIGVGAVIAMVVIGQGAKAKVEETFTSMGTNVIIINPGSVVTGGAKAGAGTISTLTFDDLRAMQEELPSIHLTAALLKATCPLIAEDQNWTTTVNGTTPEYFQIRVWAASAGSTFDVPDVEHATKVAMIGQTVAEKLFGSADAKAVGRKIRIKNVPFQVLGILERKGQSPSGYDFDDQVFIPISTFQRQIAGGLHNYINKGAIYVAANPSFGTTRAQADIESLLRERHHLAADAEPDFLIKNLDEIAKAKQESTETLTTFLAGIAAVSLLVGGIGIMNIMLVSVTERTREIGLRMAVGAQPRDILLQFLVEAVSLSALGGVLGIAVGLGAAQRLAARFQWPVKVQPELLVVAVGFSALVGIVFGVYPARKAAQLDPIDALRYE